MKTSKIVFFVTLLFISTFFLSCKKENVTPPDTSLIISVNDESGNIESGAKVSLYTSLTSNDSIVQYTDTKGIAKFTGLSPIVYYWSVIAGCKTNLFGNYKTSTPIISNIDNKVETVVKGAGVVSFVNNSTNPYKVYANGVVVYDSMNGKSSKVDVLASGNYTFRVLQLSGYALYPTDQSYNGTLACGGNLNVIFP